MHVYARELARELSGYRLLITQALSGRYGRSKMRNIHGPMKVDADHHHTDPYKVIDCPAGYLGESVRGNRVCMIEHAHFADEGDPGLCWLYRLAPRSITQARDLTGPVSGRERTYVSGGYARAISHIDSHAE